jgi:hypothetical protein
VHHHDMSQSAIQAALPCSADAGERRTSAQ